MKSIYLSLIVFLCIGITQPAISQVSDAHLLDSLFAKRSEVYFSFRVPDKEDIHYLTRIISIDHVKGKAVRAYANRHEFADFLNYNLDYTILPHPGSLLSEAEINPEHNVLKIHNFLD